MYFVYAIKSVERSKENISMLVYLIILPGELINTIKDMKEQQDLTDLSLQF